MACVGRSMSVVSPLAPGAAMEKAPRKVEPLALTPEEVADALSVSRHTIYRLIERGNSPTVRIGRLHRVRKVDLERWIEEHLNSAS